MTHIDHQMCMVRHDPPTSHGDCVRACIAVLLGLNTRDVPHFTADGCDGDTMMQRMRDWLAPRGLVPMTVAFPASDTPEPLFEFMGGVNPGVPYMLLSADHAVACRNGAIEHDPAWVRKSLVAPLDGWLIVALVQVADA